MRRCQTLLEDGISLLVATSIAVASKISCLTQKKVVSSVLQIIYCFSFSLSFHTSVYFGLCTVIYFRKYNSVESQHHGAIEYAKGQQSAQRIHYIQCADAQAGNEVVTPHIYFGNFKRITVHIMTKQSLIIKRM